MSGKIAAALKAWLDAGLNRVGEVSIAREGDGFVLTHHTDAEAHEGLKVFHEAADALEIARHDAAGEFRPLKSAPDLKRGWKLVLRDTEGLQTALDFFYPAMAGVRVAFLENRIAPVHFRETAGRQSGMYDVVKKITDEQADALAGDFCKSDGKCLKTILWRLDSGTPLTSLPAAKFDPDVDQCGSSCGPVKNAMPLLCTEACNLFVAAAREVVLKSRKKS